TKQIQRLFKDRAKLIRQHINIDDMLSTSKQIAKVRKPMSANYRKDFGGHRLSASFVRIPVAEAANASGSSPIVAIDSSNTTTDTNNNNKNNNNNNNNNANKSNPPLQKNVVKLTKSGTYFYNTVQSIIGNVSELLHAGKFYQDLTRKLCNVVVMEMIGLVEFYVTSLNRKLELAGK
ncbi:SH2 domain-containing protein, partial [Reticulomyxa filosa]